jgi:opacity protein-like surface antigen
MKKILITLASMVCMATAQAGTVVVAAGVGQENITYPKTFTVDLYQVAVSYRYDNGVYVGTSIQNGYPELSSIPSESRYEAYTGYAKKIDKFIPYTQLAVGRRDINSATATDYNYYALTVGTKYEFTSKIYGDVMYRYRNNYDTSSLWKTNLYGVGLGYKVTPTVSVETGYALTYGDYESNQYRVFLIQRF